MRPKLVICRFRFLGDDNRNYHRDFLEVGYIHIFRMRLRRNKDEIVMMLEAIHLLTLCLTFDL